MKLIIRDEKPKDVTCEIWVERRDDDNVILMSRLNDGPALVEVDLFASMRASHTPNGNFKWEEEWFTPS